jgi:hypothetical protein
MPPNFTSEVFIVVNLRKKSTVYIEVRDDFGLPN